MSGDIFARLEQTRLCTPWRDDGKECRAAATWLYRISCCGNETPLCDEHMSENAVDILTTTDFTAEWKCYACKNVTATYGDADVTYEKLSRDD